MVLILLDSNRSGIKTFGASGPVTFIRDWGDLRPVRIPFAA